MEKHEKSALSENFLETNLLRCARSAAQGGVPLAIFGEVSSGDQPREPQTLRQEQLRLLADTLRRARELPGYRDHFSGVNAELTAVEQLWRIPVLERQDVQRNPGAFRDRTVPSMELHTSGSTGMPLTYYLARKARWRRLAQYARFFMMHGWRPWHRMLTMKLLQDSSARVGGSCLDRSVFCQRTVVSVLDSPEAQFRVLQQIDPHYLHGFPSALEQLSSQVRRHRWRPKRLRCVFTASEGIEPGVRMHIEQALDAPVVDQYGAVEGFVGWQCERRDGYHFNVGSVFVEIVDDDGRPVCPGEIGRVVITTLDNPAMPLVRYAIGDLAVAGDGTPCPCGRPEPILPRIIGRTVDMFQFRSGPRSPWALISRMREIDSLMRFQLAQTDSDTVEVRFRAVDNGCVDRKKLHALARSELGDGIRLELRETIDFQRLPSGKFATALRLRPESSPELASCTRAS